MGVGSAPKSLQTAGKTVDVVEVHSSPLIVRERLGLSMLLTLFLSVSWRAQISPAVVEFAEKHFGFKTNGKVNR